jgi:sugar phosphate isomerase/epimerase
MAIGLKIGVVSVALSNDAREAAARARKMGFAGVQFEAFAPGLALPELSGSGRREFRKLLSSQDQQLVGLRLDLGAKGLGPTADVDRALARIDQAMEAAAGLGAPLVCVELGPLPEPARSTAAKPKVDPAAAGIIIIPSAADVANVAAPEPQVQADPAMESAVDGALAELGRRADRYSCVVAVRSELSSFAALDRALRAAACPWFGVDLDPVAVLRDRWDVEEVFGRVGPLVRHVRGRDALAGQDKRTKPAALGQGGTDWGQLIALLDEAGFAGWVTLDPLELPDRAGAAAVGLSALKKLTS